VYALSTSSQLGRVQADELERTNNEAIAKEATLREAREIAAKEEAELKLQLYAAEQAVSNAQTAVQRLAAEVSHLQVWACQKLRL